MKTTGDSPISELIPDEWVDEWKMKTAAKTGGPTPLCIPPDTILGYVNGKALTPEQGEHLRSCAYCQEVERLFM